MIIGDTDRFGIEFELDSAKLAEPTLTEWRYGRVRWWCSGEQVGRYETDTTLRDVSVEAERFLKFEGQRQDEVLLHASGAEVVRTITEALYEDRGQSDEQVEADEQHYRRFVVKPQLDVFDSWDIFLVEGEHARLIWRQIQNADVHECELASGEFDSVLKRFLAALYDASLPA